MVGILEGKGKEENQALSQSSQHLEVERGPQLGLSLGQWLLCHIVRLLPQLQDMKAEMVPPSPAQQGGQGWWVLQGQVGKDERLTPEWEAALPYGWPGGARGHHKQTAEPRPPGRLTGCVSGEVVQGLAQDPVLSPTHVHHIHWQAQAWEVQEVPGGHVGVGEDEREVGGYTQGLRGMNHPLQVPQARHKAPLVQTAKEEGTQDVEEGQSAPAGGRLGLQTTEQDKGHQEGNQEPSLLVAKGRQQGEGHKVEEQEKRPGAGPWAPGFQCPWEAHLGKGLQASPQLLPRGLQAMGMQLPKEQEAVDSQVSEPRMCAMPCQVHRIQVVVQEVGRCKDKGAGSRWTREVPAVHSHKRHCSEACPREQRQGLLGQRLEAGICGSASAPEEKGDQSKGQKGGPVEEASHHKAPKKPAMPPRAWSRLPRCAAPGHPGGHQYQQPGKEQSLDGIGEGPCVEDQGDVGPRQQEQGIPALRPPAWSQVVHSQVQGKGEGGEEESGPHQQQVATHRARPWPPVFPEPEEPEGRARGQQWEDHRAAGAAGVKLPGPGGLNAQDIPCRKRRRGEPDPSSRTW